MKEELLRFINVTKEIEGECLISNININIFVGEILGLLAREDRGKEELIKLIRENTEISYGKIFFNNKLVNNYEYSDGTINPVYVISHKENLIRGFSIADNIFVMRKCYKKYLVNKKVLEEQLKTKIIELDIELDLRKAIDSLSSLERCLVELIKAEISRCKLIILYDLSNFLSPLELMSFQRVLRKYCDRGFSFLYVGNHHEELFRICDRMALLSEGRILKVFQREEMTDDKMQPFIMDSFGLSESKTFTKRLEAVLEFNNIDFEELSNINFSLVKGECITFLDMSNTASSSILKLMTKGFAPRKGEILLNNSIYTTAMSRSFLKNKIAVIEENPTETMLFDELSYIDNLTLLLDSKESKGLLRSKYIKSLLREYRPMFGDLMLKSSLEELTLEEKYILVYYKIHLFNPKVVFCIKPFARGDMFIRDRIIKLIEELKKRGITVIILTVSITDCLEVSDRLLIINNGNITAEYHREVFDRIKENYTIRTY